MEVAEQLGVTKEAVQQLLARGLLVGTRPNRRNGMQWQIRATAVRRAMEHEEVQVLVADSRRRKAQSA